MARATGGPSGTSTMKRAILLFGYPGSGKGTQGQILSALPGFDNVAMGDILRGLTAAHALYEAIQRHVRQGNLVPDELVMDLFARHIEPLGKGPNDLLVVDGIPRNRRQVDLLRGLVDVIKIFKLSVYDEQIVIDRIRQRARAQNRPDDGSDQVIKHRMEVYRNETESCITAFPGSILTRIQANQPVFDVHLDIISALGKMRNITFR